MSTSEVSKRSTFMYFGYGSNLLAKRLLIQNPSAIRKGSGVLKVTKKHLFCIANNNKPNIIFVCF